MFLENARPPSAQISLVNAKKPVYNELEKRKNGRLPACIAGGIVLKKAFKFCLLAIAAAAVMTLGGCSARSSVSYGDFEQKAEAAGFKVSEQTAPSEEVTKDLSAVKDGSDTQFNFLTFDTPTHAQSWYFSQKDSLPAGGQTLVDSDSYNKFTLSNGEIYYVLVRMDNTFLSCQTTVSKADEVGSFLSSIKY